jgi:phage tail-like protein
MSKSSRRDPFLNNRFIVEIADVNQVTFTEVIFPESESNVIEHREGNDKDIIMRKQSGLTTNSCLILKGGLTGSMELYNWRKLVEQGKVSSARRKITITLLDEENRPAAKWEFTNAWPSKYRGPDLNALANDVAVETVEIVFESMQRVN